MQSNTAPSSVKMVGAESSVDGEPGGNARSTIAERLGVGDGATITTNEFNQMRRLMPFQNMPVIGELLDMVGGSVFDEFE